MSDRNTIQPNAKKAYERPQLTVFGLLSKLTQNGSSITKENNGQGRCGAGFGKSGSASC